MPISYLVVLIAVLLCLIIFLSLYYKIQVIINLDSDKPEQLLLVEIIPSLSRHKKHYQYARRDISDIFKFHFTNRVLRTHKKIKNYLDHYHVFNLYIHYTVLETVEWKTRIGINDAMYTAIISGFLWSVKGTLISKASSKTRLQKVLINVQPDFSRASIKSRLVCIFKLRIVHIIIIAIYAYCLKVRGYMIGFAARTTIKSSHRGTYENSHAEYKRNG